MLTKMQFSYLVGALVMSMAISSFAGDIKDTQSNESIQLEKFGVTFTKPHGWHSQNAEEFQKTREKFNSLKETDLLFILAAQGDIPVASFLEFDPTKHPGIIPAITVLVRPNNSLDFPDFFEMIKSSSESFKKYFNNVVMTVEAVEVSVSGKRSVMLEFEYDLNLADGNQYRIRSTAYAIPFKDAFIQVGMAELSSIKKSKQFDHFIETLEIKNK